MPTVYELGPFRLDPEARVLTHEGVATALGARGVAVLSVLVGHHAEYVEKSAILDAAWPGLVVEEANLAVQISAIRRALARVPGGEGWIETLARRGYRFVGPVKQIAARSVAPLLANRKRTNLPESLTSFLGRERELVEIKQRLRVTRLMTLTGIGGLGKTRLAQQAAAEMLDAYRDGVWFVDLAPLGDPAFVPSALAHVLQVKETAGQLLLNALCEHLRTRQTLLILDNCEHVLDGCARLTEALLRDAAQVTVMATSREVLHLAGEYAFPVSALPLPDPQADRDTIAGSDAVQLFTERARQHRPRFDLEAQRARVVAEICVRLDGIPLALELAAARIAVLPVEQILNLLTERFRLLTSGDRDLPRHQTLRAMLDWSYDLLDDAERKLFARLSVFAGGWTLEDASEVCSGEPIPKNDVVHLLIRLIEQSLVVAEENGDRYRMLETVRQHARLALEESGEVSAWRTRHLEHFVALGEQADPNLTGDDQQTWLDRLETEHDNLRVALAWASEGDGEPTLALRLAAAVWWLWLVRGYWTEGICHLDAAIEATCQDRAADLCRAKALNAAGALLGKQDDYRSACVRYEQALAIYRELGDRRGVAMSLTNLGNAAREQGNYAEARAFHEEAVSIYRALGPRWSEAIALGNLGIDVCDQGDYPYATTLYEQALAIFRERGDRRSIALALNFLGIVAQQRGMYSRAKALHEESLALFRDLGDRWGIAWVHLHLGKLASAREDHDCAFALFKESLATQQEIGERLGITESLEGLGYLAFHRSGCRRAIGVWAVAERLRKEIGARASPGDRARYDEQVAVVRAAFGDDKAFEVLWREGAVMSLSQAIEWALDDAR